MHYPEEAMRGMARGCFLEERTFRRAAGPPLRDVQVITINAGRSTHLARLLDGLSSNTRSAACIVVEMGEAAAHPLVPRRDIHRVSLDKLGLPLAAARNAGRRAALAEVLIFLDVDCIPSADLVAAMLKHSANQDALICCEVTYLPAGVAEDGWTEARLRQASLRHRARLFPAAGLSEAPHPGLFWSLAFAVRAATFDRIGGFDEGFDGYGAEIPISRFERPLWPFRCCSAPKATHSIRGTPRTTRPCSISLTSCATPGASETGTGFGRCGDGSMLSRPWN